MSIALIFDTEMTGKDNPEIVEAAYMSLMPRAGEQTDLIQPLVAIDEFQRRYRPSGTITFGAIAKHHIWPDELAHCPHSSEFALPAGCQYIIGHSIDFDWKAIGSPDVKRICTHAMATHVWPEADAFSLVALVYMTVGVSARPLAQQAHGAFADVMLCKLLLEQILMRKPEIQTWAQLWEFSEACRIPIYCPFKNREGVKLVDLDGSYIDWCLSQYWLDPYLRKGLEAVLEARGNSRSQPYGDDWDDEDDLDEDPPYGMDEDHNHV